MRLLFLFLAISFLIAPTYANAQQDPLKAPIMIPKESRPDTTGLPVEPPPIRYTDFIDNETFAKLPVEIQAEIVNEAEMVSNECKSRAIFARYHDCDCIGAKFIDARVLDPETHFTLIGHNVAAQCPNAPAVAAYQYNRCITTTDVPERVEIQDFCKCYANEFGRLYEDNSTATFSASRLYDRIAYKKCNEDFKIGEFSNDFE
jgi:hypothetical protein